jgi:hypothetical protein
MTAKRRIFSIIYWLLLWQVLLVACSSVEHNPPIDFEEAYINQQILLSTPAHFNAFNTKDPIYLEIRSTSNYEITLPNKLNVRVFQRKAGDWIEIGEWPTTRLPPGDVVFAPNKKLRQTITVAPALGNNTQRSNLRIYVSGDMHTDEGTKQVAAYVDVTLHP